MSTLNVLRCTRTEFSTLEPEVGQVVVIDNGPEEDAVPELKMWDGTGWTDIKADTNSTVELTAYDINKQIIGQLPTLNDEEMIEKKKMIRDFKVQMNNVYYMLLCRELNYYTILVSRATASETMEDVVIECAQVHGEIKAIESVDGAIEIWVSSPFDTHAMYFFPYDRGVEKCQ